MNGYFHELCMQTDNGYEMVISLGLPWIQIYLSTLNLLAIGTHVVGMHMIQIRIISTNDGTL